MVFHGWVLLTTVGGRKYLPSAPAELVELGKLPLDWVKVLVPWSFPAPPR